MRCRAYRYPGAPRQLVAVLWDGMKAAEIGPDPGFGEQGFTVPAELATAGNHRLSFEPAYFGRPAGSLDRNGSPAPRHPRKLSFGCNWIEIGRGPEPGVARGEGGTLWIPAATEVSFLLEPERDLELRWESLSARGGSRLKVVWEVEGAEPLVAAVTRDTEPVVDLPLPTGTEIRSQFGTSRRRGDSGGGEHEIPGILPARLTLRAAAGEPGAAEEPGVAVRSARLMGKAPALAGREAASGGSRPPEPEQNRPESMLLWIVDTLRVDRLGFYGHGRPVSPNFDALAGAVHGVRAGDRPVVVDPAHRRHPAHRRRARAAWHPGAEPRPGGVLRHPAGAVAGTRLCHRRLLGERERDRRHREVLDIPFLIHRPGQTEARRVPLPVQQADLLPTLIEIAGG